MNESISHRRLLRANCRLLVWFGDQNRGTSNAAVTANVSLEGLFVRTRNVQPVGKTLLLEVDLAGCKMPMRGVVAWNRNPDDTSEGADVGFGVSLVDAPFGWLDYVLALPIYDHRHEETTDTTFTPPLG